MRAVGHKALGKLIGEMRQDGFTCALRIFKTGQVAVEELVPAEIGTKVRIVLVVLKDPPTAADDMCTVVSKVLKVRE